MHTRGRELCRDPGLLQDESKKGGRIDGTDKKGENEMSGEPERSLSSKR